MEREESVDGDEGRVGGVSGRMPATVRYPFVSEYIFATRWRFAARRRKAKSKQIPLNRRRAAATVMATTARAGSRPEVEGSALCEGPGRLLSGPLDADAVDSQHGPTSTVNVVLVS